MAEKKCILIELTYDNGEKWAADGEDAETILKYWQSGETMHYIHGAHYIGPTLKQIIPERREG